MLIAFKSLSVSPFEILECTGARGDTYDAILLSPSRAQDYVGVSLYTKGVIKVSRISGKANGDGEPWVWNPREFSGDRPLPPIVSPGTFRFEVMSESATYYCIRRADRGPLSYEIVRAENGVIRLAKGERLFVADGAAALSGVELAAPRLIYAASGDRDLVVRRDVFGMILRD